MANISRRNLIKKLRSVDFDGPYSGTRHQFMLKGSHKLRIPNPHESDVSGALLSEIIRQSGISRKQWDKL